MGDDDILARVPMDPLGSAAIKWATSFQDPLFGLMALGLVALVFWCVRLSRQIERMHENYVDLIKTAVTAIERSTAVQERRNDAQQAFMETLRSSKRDSSQ